MDAWLHGILGPCLSVCMTIPNFVFVFIDYDFPKYDFGMLTQII